MGDTVELTWNTASLTSILVNTGVLPCACAAALGATYYPLQAVGVGGLGLAALLAGLVPGGGSYKASIVEHPFHTFKAVFFASTYAVPAYLIRRAVELEGAPSLLQLLVVFAETFAIVGGCMSVCLHRYFSHQAFKTSRPMQAILAIAGCHAYQGDPVWWASKHVRHHRHCDTPEDPHSWLQSGYWYAWVGWTMAPSEQGTDSEFIPSLLRFPELRVIGAVWWLWPLLTAQLVYKHFGFYNMVLYTAAPMLMSRIVTLLFNVEYHAPGGSLNGDGEAKKGCLSLDMPRFLADCVGESCHDDHHSHPCRAKRPSGGIPYVDLPYWLVIKPLLLTGLVWGARYK